MRALTTTATRTSRAAAPRRTRAVRFFGRLAVLWTICAVSSWIFRSLADSLTPGPSSFGTTLLQLLLQALAVLIPLGAVIVPFVARKRRAIR